jgi:hypothetical protein
MTFSLQGLSYPQLSNRINKIDELVLQSDKHRTQTENYKDCVEKLYALIFEAIVVPGETSKEKQKRVEDLYVGLSTSAQLNLSSLFL